MVCSALLLCNGMIMSTDRIEVANRVEQEK